MKKEPDMKRLLSLLVVMGAVGCGASLTDEEKGVVGTYEQVLGDETYRWVLLKNRSYETHFPDSGVETGTWVMQDGFHDAFGENYQRVKAKHKEVHAQDGDDYTTVFRVMPDGTLRSIAGILENGQRMQIPGYMQDVYIKQAGGR